MKFWYRSSLQKWERLKEVANKELKDRKLCDLCSKLIEKIKDRGDAELDYVVTVEVNTYRDFYSVIYNGVESPCPHCVVYVDCNTCPLHDGNYECCAEWEDIREHVVCMMREDMHNLSEIVYKYRDIIIDLLIREHREFLLDKIKEIMIEGYVEKIEKDGSSVLVEVDCYKPSTIPKRPLEYFVARELGIPAILINKMSDVYSDKIKEAFDLKDEDIKKAVDRAKEKKIKHDDKIKMREELRRKFDRMHLGKVWIIQD